MSQTSVRHSSFVVERRYDAPSSRVFAAWADPEAKRRWFGGPEAWLTVDHELDFRVGGREINRVGPSDGPLHTFDALADTTTRPLGRSPSMRARRSTPPRCARCSSRSSPTTAPAAGAS
jgi:hypothetical protein